MPALGLSANQTELVALAIGESFDQSMVAQPADSMTARPSSDILPKRPFAALERL